MSNGNNKYRAPVYMALDAMPDLEWAVLLQVIKPVNTLIGNTIVDDPTPNANLNVAIDKELTRLKNRPNE